MTALHDIHDIHVPVQRNPVQKCSKFLLEFRGIFVFRQHGPIGSSLRRFSFGLDTINSGIHVDPEEIDLLHWREQTAKDREEVGDRIVKNYWIRYIQTLSGSTITLKYVVKDFQAKLVNRLHVEFSLPKLLYGCNHRDLEDWGQAFDLADATIGQIPGLPPLPSIRYWTLFRLDICANFYVGNLVADYIATLRNRQRSRRTLVCTDDTSVLWKAGVISEIAYDKFREPECGHEEARGVLRMEIRLKKPRKIRQCFVKECETLADLSRPALLEKIVQLVADLGLDQPIQSNRLVVREMLGEHYKPGTVARLTDFWECRRTHSLAQMQDGLHYQLRTIQRYEKQLAAAGVSPTANPGNVVLPALSELIADDLRMDNEERKDQELSQTPSATRSFEVFNMRQGDLSARQGRSGFPETHEIPVHLKPWIDHAGRTGSPNHVLNDEGDPASAAGPRSTAAWRHRLVRSSPEVLPSPQGPIEWVGGEIDNREVPQPGPAPPGPRLQIRRSVYCITSS